MKSVSPAELHCPIRPQPHSLSSGRGRALSRTEVGVGMGERATGDSEVLGNEDAGEVVDAEEESQPVNSLPSPDMPTQSERDDHDIAHHPYRSWCKHCVEGRGVEMGHRLGDEHCNRGVAIVGFDYMFVTDGNAYSRDEWDASDEKSVVDPANVLKVLVVRDMRSKALFAHAVVAKGADAEGFAVQCVVEDVLWLGYSRVILKSDNEPAIVRLLKESSKVLRVEGLEQAAEEHPPPYDPQSNGDIEVGVKFVNLMALRWE